MKRIYHNLFDWLAIACLCLLTACSGEEGILEQAATKGETTERALITAELPNLTSGGLKTALEASLGENSLKVQKLTLGGEIDINDALHLKKLTLLEELDMSGLTFKESSANDENSYHHYLPADATCDQMLSGLSHLTTVVFPTSIKGIGYATCEGCASLSSVILPQGLESIGNNAFANCKKLTAVSLPASLITIEWSAFAECQALTSISIPENATNLGSGIFSGCTNLKSAKILAKVSSLNSSMFSYCSNLEEVVLNESITELQFNAFYECTSLKDYTPFTKITKIGNDCFTNCKFTSVDLSAVTFIGSYAFQNCTELSSVQTGNNLTEIYYGVFTSCTKLKELAIPASLTTIGGTFIDGCINLTAMFWNSAAEVPDSYLGDRCFLYLANADTPYGSNWKNVIKAGEADLIELRTDYGDSENNLHSFYCPQTFTAKRITYTRSYSLQTPPGVSAGWYTLVLPFNPTTITHETKGTIAPFNSGVENAKPFWLRKPTKEGFVDATEIEANTPYIISMPNDPSSYWDEYCLNGTVTFSAENVTIEATAPTTLATAEGPGYYLHPTYDYVPKSGQVYALNIDYGITDYYNGSVFARLSSNVYPFEVYATTGSTVADTRNYLGIDPSSAATRSAAGKVNKTGIPQIGDR